MSILINKDTKVIYRASPVKMGHSIRNKRSHMGLKWLEE